MARKTLENQWEARTPGQDKTSYAPLVWTWSKPREVSNRQWVEGQLRKILFIHCQFGSLRKLPPQTGFAVEQVS